MTGIQIIYSASFGGWVLFTGALISGIGKYRFGSKPMRVSDFKLRSGIRSWQAS